MEIINWWITGLTYIVACTYLVSIPAAAPLSGCPEFTVTVQTAEIPDSLGYPLTLMVAVGGLTVHKTLLFPCHTTRCPFSLKHALCSLSSEPQPNSGLHQKASPDLLRGLRLRGSHPTCVLLCRARHNYSLCLFCECLIIACLSH